MSTRMMGLVWPLTMPATHKAVLVSISDQANDAGECWPSVATLCERTCLSERTVRLALRALETAGYMLTQLNGRRSNVYVLRVAMLERLEAQRMAERAKQLAELEAEAERRENARKGPAPVRGQEMPPSDDAARVNQGGTTCPEGAGAAGKGGTTCPQTIIEPIQIQTPHTPQAPPGGLPGSSDSGRRRARGDGVTPAIEIGTWLAQCRELGEKPIPEGDPIFKYCEDVGLPLELLKLCWREFKRRQEAAKVRQRDWRQKFRNCVEASWYGLWIMPPGEPPRLSSKGEQAQRYFAAIDAAAQAEGDAP